MATARKTKPKKGIDPYRKSLYGKIEIAKKQLGIDDDAYRDIIARMFPGKTSRTQMGNGQLVDLIEEFKRLGFKPKSKKGPKKAPARAGTRPLAPGEHQAKMRALWIALYHLAVVRDPSEQALAMFAYRMTQVAALQWLDPEQGNKVVEALKAMAEREANVSWAPYYPRPKMPVYKPRLRVIEAQWKVLLQVSPNLSGNDELKTHILERTVRGVPISDMTDEQADQAIENLGKYIREELSAQGFETLKDWRGAKS